MTNSFCQTFHCGVCDGASNCGLRDNNVKYEFSKSREALETAELTMPEENKKVVCSNFVARALCLMLNNKGTVLEKDIMCNFIWQGRIVGENSLPVLINEIRKILKVTRSKFMIVTIRGVGYMCVEG
ncbi:winged helix-turn-helix domain-containing protein [Shewanella khirikhana]|uniref:winged helix-turn-helix domain-containing protein n=1 Tax=Shewanella khirikhana TaxID=1965282 RepID=UPI0030CC620C